jgi:hypothetical protein
MNPELLKDPKECGYGTDFPHWDLYLTDEIKEKVFAKYLRNRWKFRNDVKGFEKAIKHQLHLTDINDVLFNPEYKECGGIVLILKPLSKISYEDIIHIIKDIHGIKKELNKVFYEEGYLKFEHFDKWDRTSSIRVDKFITYDDAVYLISKGYDLPNYLLCGKTLFECGLAIYEN